MESNSSERTLIHDRYFLYFALKTNEKLHTSNDIMCKNTNILFDICNQLIEISTYMFYLHGNSIQIKARI
jgi:hypothetical protein